MSINELLKNYGEAIHPPSYIIDTPPKVISVSPKIDIALGGGVPEGCLFIMTGPEKVGKTVHALQFAKNAQNTLTDDGKKRVIIYGNVEGRLKKRDLEGIYGLDLSDEYFRIIGSTKGSILTGEKYLEIFDKFIHGMPNCVEIIDSFSALAAEDELIGDISDIQVAAMNRYISKFTRRFANVLPINKVTLVGITHLMANIQRFGAGKTKTEKSGNALKYAQDVKLWATHKEPLKRDKDSDVHIGQEVHWIVENSALGAPGKKVTSYIKYGRGIWNELEIAELAKDFGIIEGSKWYTIPDVKEKIQGIQNVAIYLEENPVKYEEIRKLVYTTLGFTS